MIFDATEQDLDAIASIEKELFSLPWTRENFADAIKQPYAKLWVAKDTGNDNDCVTGYLCMYCSVDEGEITTVAVAPEFRKQGYGHALIHKAQEYVLEQNLERIVLEVRVSNSDAIALYTKNEFENLGIRKGFYDFPKEDAMIMAWEKNKC